jgi:tetratricopeptide (TPR) repeat protein
LNIRVDFPVYWKSITNYHITSYYCQYKSYENALKLVESVPQVAKSEPFAILIASLMKEKLFLNSNLNKVVELLAGTIESMRFARRLVYHLIQQGDFRNAVQIVERFKLQSIYLDMHTAATRMEKKMYAAISLKRFKIYLENYHKNTPLHLIYTVEKRENAPVKIDSRLESISDIRKYGFLLEANGKYHEAFDLYTKHHISKDAKTAKILCDAQ